jgi:prolyl-tRNA editing enzyme YbaK/EbsC (Cys-tRNA(Pro) deacylase)
MEIKTLVHNVISCKEAAGAKNIPLSHELKSLVLITGKGMYLLHLSGEKMADLRSVKKYLGCKQVCLASREDLKVLNVKPGTVNPFYEKLSILPQLISTELLELEFVSTNAGELNKYVIFKPNLLLSGNEIHIGNFSK